MDVNSKQEQSRQPEINYTELLMREYGDPISMRQADWMRKYYNDSDETIYRLLESFD